MRTLAVVGAVAVAVMLGHLTMLFARSATGYGAGGVLLFFALFGFVVLPAGTGALIAATGAGTPVARTGLAGLILLLPLALLSGWAAAAGTVTDAQDGWRQVLDPGALEPLLIVTAFVLVPSLLGYGVTTLARRSG